MRRPPALPFPATLPDRADSPEEAALLGKTKCILAGVPFFDAVFAELGCTVQWHAKEGDVITPPMRVATVRGPCRNILLGERTALNIVSRASGVATASRELVDIAASAGWHGEVAGTRKVTPGFRLVEKYALLVGGASTHRMDLSAMVMLKGACGAAGRGGRGRESAGRKSVSSSHHCARCRPLARR